MAQSPISRRSLIARGATISAATALHPALLRASSERSGVVATFSILGDWVAQVGGDLIDLTVIVPAGGDAHAFDPSPAQVASIADANAIFEIGLEFETWLDGMFEASGSDAARVVVSDGMDLITADDDGHDDDHEDDHGEFDPHVWHDVANAIHAVRLIAEHLAETDPANAETYEEHAAAYLADLEATDASIRERVATIPVERRKLVTTHDTLSYYARAYGFEVVGTALSSITTESGDPAAGEIAALVGAIQEAGVPAIFAENIIGSDLMETIASEAGVELAPTLYSDALGDVESEAATYVELMEYNTRVIVEALGE